MASLVIDAFNRNLPFDQFTIEQLAGDLLPEANRSQKIATGFNRCNITTNEGGIFDEEYAVLYARDRVETTFAVWIGKFFGACHLSHVLAKLITNEVWLIRWHKWQITFSSDPQVYLCKPPIQRKLLAQIAVSS